AAALAALLFALALAAVFQLLIARAFPAPWVARPGPAIGAFWLLGLFAALGLAGLMGRRVSLAGLWAGVWVFWSLLGLLLAILLPGVSYLVVVPALVAGVCGLAFGGSAGGRTLAAVLPPFAAALLWFPVCQFLYLGLGLTGLLGTTLLLALVLSTLTPLMSGSGGAGRRWLPLTALVLAVASLVWARASPPFSPASPQNVGLLVHQDAISGETRFIVQGGPPFPPALREAAPFGRDPVPFLPWLPPFVRAFVAPAPPLTVPGPELAVVADSAAGGKRHLRLRMSSPRGARVETLFIPADAQVEAIDIEGVAVPMGGRQRGWQPVTYHTVPAGGALLDLVLGSTQPADWYVADRTYDLPPSARALVAARPKDAAALQKGDGTLVSRKVRL
ncbi:MAG TPA: hypothetical protein VGG20_02915, partial [Thermoanaerobaculia bacterium]